MAAFTRHAKDKIFSRLGVMPSKRRMEEISLAIKKRRFNVLREDRMGNRVLQIPALGIRAVQNVRQNLIITVYPDKDEPVWP